MILLRVMLELRDARLDPRHVPPHFKHTVWERDGGQCTFTSASGRRCPATKRLEYDDVDPVACGGQSTVENLRLRCATHNQYEAECVSGAGFMSAKREAARSARGALRAATAAATATTTDPEKDVIPWLRKLGVHKDEAHRIAVSCEALPPETSLEEQVRFAVRQLAPPCRTVTPPLAAAS